MPARKAITKHDVALAEVHRKASREVILARGFIWAVALAASTLPINALHGIVGPLAGETTIVDFNFVVSITLAASLLLNGFQYLKGRSQRSGLERQRDIIDEHEEDDK